MFCWTTNAEKDGLGKIVQMDGSTCVIEYFDSPTEQLRYRRTVEVSSVRRKRLGRNTRVFIFDEGMGRWSIGRVRDDDGEGVEVRLAHKQDVYLPYVNVFVRWKRPITDPVDFLANFVTETPQYAEARSGFMRNYLYQRGAAFGISALLSSSIELEPHQVDVVRRVLTDHTQRYLLADEVGLGKTIEAGVVIRQIVLDDMRGHRVVVLAPKELVQQWREELIDRFGLRDFLDDSVFVLPQEASDELEEVCRELTLLVIDEAHHITAANSSKAEHHLYELVREIAHQTPKLLLLSATPILRNEAGFLRMLNLLDPLMYPLDDLESFRLRISNRQALAETVASLDPSNALFMDSALDDLLHRLPGDTRLRELTLALKGQLLDFPEEDDPSFRASVGQLRAHLSETYRLNRRVLRNRRTQIEGLTPERKGVQIWQVHDSSMAQIEANLENWRFAASLSANESEIDSTRDLEKFYWNVVGCLQGSMNEVSRICTQRRKDIETGVLAGFEGEIDLLDSILISADHETWMNRRLERLYEGLQSLPPVIRAVIFCSNKWNADRVFEYLNEAKISVVRHSVHHETEHLNFRAWRDFLNAPDVRAIVCDQGAEEGINLQGGSKAVIHFDLPLQPNRIEQRMGRVDRYGAGNPVASFVLADSNASLQMAWFQILNQGLGVFDRSISGLQYLVEAELATLARSLLYEGIEGLDTLCSRLEGDSGEVSRELRLIDQQDALDQLSPVPEQELDDLFDADADWRRINESMTYWIEETLLFDKVKSTVVSTQSVDVPFRFHYCPPDSGSGRVTLIPLSDFLEGFLGAIDFEAPGSRSTRPQSYPYVTHRPTAVKHNKRPFRYGTEFVEAIHSFSQLDDRGRSYAMWRQVLDEGFSKEIQRYFRFDFLIETNLDEAQALLAEESSKAIDSKKSSLVRRGDTLFCPTVIQVWLDEEGDEISEAFINRYLAPGYAKLGGNGYLDKNLDAQLLAALNRYSPDSLTNWRETCGRLRDRAKAVVMSKPDLLVQQNNAIDRALEEDEIRYAQIRARIQSLSGLVADLEERQLRLEETLNAALHRGISTPKIKVDVAGVVFLTSEPVTTLDRYLRE